MINKKMIIGMALFVVVLFGAFAYSQIIAETTSDREVQTCMDMLNDNRICTKENITEMKNSTYQPPDEVTIETLQMQINTLKAKLCMKDNSYSWCVN